MTPRHTAAGLAVMSNEYDNLTAGTIYAADGNRWLNNILGANAWGTSLIVGDGTTFPDCMQHQVANIVGSTNGKPPILLGAVVEGPNSFAAKATLTGMVACPPNGVDVFAKFNGMAPFIRTTCSPIPQWSRPSTCQPRHSWPSPGRSRELLPALPNRRRKN